MHPIKPTFGICGGKATLSVEKATAAGIWCVPQGKLDGGRDIDGIWGIITGPFTLDDDLVCSSKIVTLAGSCW